MEVKVYIVHSAMGDIYEIQVVATRLSEHKAVVESISSWKSQQELVTELKYESVPLTQFVFNFAIPAEVLELSKGVNLVPDIMYNELQKSLLEDFEIKEVLGKTLDILSGDKNTFSLPLINPAADVLNSFSVLSNSLPSMSASVDVPCVCSAYSNYKIFLRDAVMHLNDYHKWSREQVADWLDELHDSGVVDIEF